MSDDRRPLQPPNGTPLERAAAEALAEIQRVPVPLRDLWRPATCPAHLLPYLAWAFSVDRWDPTWSEAAKREVIASAFYVHQRKGTISALRRVVEPLGYLLDVIEWWETVPTGTPGTFALQIGVLDTGITDEMYTELERLIDGAKPLTRHVSALDLAGESRGTTWLAATVYDGDITSVMPFVAEETEVAGLMYLGAGTDSTDTATVYPL
ncbi:MULTISPECIES: phage tail protein I [Halomonas]|uniref:phage tail protein I n=1 Tax=Halomonas TaxID=2745 RepID=UPI001C983A26|nr:MULTISPECIES: phage tail protein I [Halomonas]MBY6206890.1 phage tail protein I [Halomonas sp. DP3Y7-2]MBY6230364.1 phage tail protein I [Halomonas sp. DP3Y7-1]MCA0918525.1 phage tail protein I [Halomonas denitrificans]